MVINGGRLVLFHEAEQGLQPNTTSSSGLCKCMVSTARRVDGSRRSCWDMACCIAP